MKDQQKAAFKMIKAVHDDKEAIINGRTYKLLKMKHKERKKIFAYYSSIQSQAEENNFSFMGTDEFDYIEAIINNHVSYNNDIISKIDGHFDEYPADYVIYCLTMMGAMSVPFLSESLMN